jgi:uncharacterized membrane protein YjjP (DUF1212 family)
MKLEEKISLLVRAARLLYVHAHPTDDLVVVVSRLGAALGTRVVLDMRWEELKIEAVDESGSVSRAIPASPTMIDMSIVTATMRMVADVVEGRLAPSAASAVLGEIERPAPTPLPIFALAAAAGAGSLATLFGADAPAVALIAASAGAGAALRRMISHYSSDAFLQQFAAAVLAGLVGTVAIHFRLSATLSLVAMAPCMILVPGVHFLNSLMDMYSARMELGGCRLLFAAIIMVAISTGLLLSLGLGGASLPVTEAGRAIPLMLDAPAAGIAAASFATFFSMPRKLLGWTVAVAVVAHVVRWVLMAFAGLSFAWAALAACAVAGAVATPIAHRLQAPFAGVGFAAVVSMIPGIFIFRTASGLIHILDQGASASSALVAATLSDAIMAAVVVLAMGIGLVTSRRIVRSWQPAMSRRSPQPQARVDH